MKSLQASRERSSHLRRQQLDGYRLRQVPIGLYIVELAGLSARARLIVELAC
jgi:very-short-patch-repair endonuclease